jgi:Mg-chelatase subunit ChlD
MPAALPGQVFGPSVERTVRGVTVGLSEPLALAALPVALAALWWLVLRGTGTAGTRSRRWLLVSRTLLVVLLVVAAAGPYTVASRETPGDPRVTMLVDRSDSMAVSPAVADSLAAEVERQGVPVTVTTVADGTDSDVGDGIAANLVRDGTVVVVSDGQVTGGRELAATGELARSLNATVATVRVPVERSERYVRVNGPTKTSVGVENTFLASVDGVDVDTATVTVEVDGQEVLTQEVEGASGVEFSHTFETTGEHRITARVGGGDGFAANDVYRRTVRVVERPRILYVSRGDYPLREYLSRLYDVDTASEVPEDLGEQGYYAVVLQDLAASEVGNVDALQRFVIDGNGLMVVGGPRAYGDGDYGQSTLESMLPVRTGNASGSTANIVLAIDVSGSAGQGMTVQKAISLDVLEQLGDANVVGIVGFNSQAYAVARPQLLATGRAEMEDRIRRLQSGGSTDIAAGLRGAREMLGDGAGTVILVSDGKAATAPAVEEAAALRRRGSSVTAVGTGPSPQEETLRAIASTGGGSYLRAGETSRLRIRFGGQTRRYSGDRLTIVEPDRFITTGVTLESNPPLSNDVTVKPGADFLVATASGSPAVASWRYGLGRVVSVTAYDGEGTLGGLLQRPDSLLVTKATNWAIGDPERRAQDVTEVPDTRVGEPTPIVYRGSARPQPANLPRFQQVGEGTYRTTVTPTSQGFETALDAEYAVNYPAEYAAFGRSPELAALVEDTGGRTFAPDEAAAVAAFARERARQVREVERRWSWVLLTVALLLFLLEVSIRRLLVYRGVSSNESGLP